MADRTEYVCSNDGRLFTVGEVEGLIATRLAWMDPRSPKANRHAGTGEHHKAEWASASGLHSLIKVGLVSDDVAYSLWSDHTQSRYGVEKTWAKAAMKAAPLPWSFGKLIRPNDIKPYPRGCDVVTAESFDSYTPTRSRLSIQSPNDIRIAQLEAQVAQLSKLLAV